MPGFSGVARRPSQGPGIWALRAGTILALSIAAPDPPVPSGAKSDLMRRGGRAIASATCHLQGFGIKAQVAPVLDGGRRRPPSLTQSTGQEYYRVAPVNCSRIRVITRLPQGTILTSIDDARMAVFRIRLGDPPISVLLATAHLLAKGPQPNTPDNQRSEANDFSRLIRKAEGKHKHMRTFVAADLNVNPTDIGLISSDGLHAVPTRHVAGWPSRQVNGKPRGPLFFNPMFSVWGDLVQRPPGTFFKGLTYRTASFGMSLIRCYSGTPLSTCLMTALSGSLIPTGQHRFALRRANRPHRTICRCTFA